MIAEEYPREIGFNEIEQARHGLRRDRNGELRDAAGLYVCDVSGDAYQGFLRDLPAYSAERGWHFLHVGDEELKRASLRGAIRGAATGLEKIGAKALRALAGLIG